ncbi:MAG: hypothetical protein NC191_01975, partial [Muribaculaceae bacterium]|nr:hypothetical protein [Muribaculaceae bacterium]
MALNNLGDGVGKKIVEALKMQDEISNDGIFVEESSAVEDEKFSSTDNGTETFSKPSEPIELSQLTVEAAFQQSLSNNLGTPAVPAYVEEFEYPANVAVLKQLITKLPA